MCRDPMPRDVLAPADPDAGMPADVVEKTLEAGRSCGMADLPEVQPDRHHLGLRRALAIEDVEGIAAEGEEIVGGREDAAAELGVVVGESVGYHEMRPAAHRDPVGKLVVVGVAVVEEPAFLDQEAARVDAGRVAAIPADGTLTHGLGERRDGAGDLRALRLLREFEMLDPAPAVAAHVEAGVADRPRRRRVALERQRAAEHGQRQAALPEDAVHAPESDAAPVLEHALRSEVAAVAQRVEARALSEPALGIAVAVADRGLGALLVVPDEVEREASAAGPLGIGWRSGVAHEVARAAVEAHGMPYLNSSCPPSTVTICPVTQAASGEARNSTTFATSSGCPSRPNGMLSRMRL